MPAAPTPTSPWWGERRSRYHFAAERVRGATVLDIACGAGFGSEILAYAGARFVVGADVEAEGISASAHPGELAFLAADGTALPFEDGSFDVATSFETIQQVDDDRTFVGELGRVLRPAGWLVLSTPNSQRVPRGCRPGPLHVRKYDPEDLRVLLQEHFGEVTLLGQITKPYYPVSPFWEDPRNAPTPGWARMQTWIWRLQDLLPFAIKDGMSRLFHNRAFFPGEFDFDFLPDQVDRGHATVAVCRR